MYENKLTSLLNDAVQLAKKRKQNSSKLDILRVFMNLRLNKYQIQRYYDRCRVNN